MHNYFTDIVWTANAAILFFLFELSIIIVFSVLTGEYLHTRRRRELLKMKQRLYKLFLSGEASCKVDFAPQRFLDVITNRNTEMAFFNKSEQAIFKRCFLTPASIRRLKALASGAFNKWQRIESLLVLGYAGISGAVDIAEKGISNKDEDISYFSMIALGQLKDARSIKSILTYLKKNPTSRYKAASVLETFPPCIVDDIVGLTKDAEPAVRMWALRAMSRFPERSMRYLADIRALTNDEFPDVRASACDCMGKVAPKEEKGFLVARLDDERWMVRASAVRALSEMLGDESIPVIIRMINDNSISVIEAVRSAMAAHIDAAIPYIGKTLDEGSAIVKVMVIEAIEETGYLRRLCGVILKGEKEAAPATELLQKLVLSGAHFGLEMVVARLNAGEREHILSVIGGADAALAEHIKTQLETRPTK